MDGGKGDQLTAQEAEVLARNDIKEAMVGGDFKKAAELAFIELKARNHFYGPGNSIGNRPGMDEKVAERAESMVVEEEE